MAGGVPTRATTRIRCGECSFAPTVTAHCPASLTTNSDTTPVFDTSHDAPIFQPARSVQGSRCRLGALEQLTWQTVIGALFDQDRLRAYLEDARLASAAARRQTEQLAVLVLRQAGRDG